MRRWINSGKAPSSSTKRYETRIDKTRIKIRNNRKEREFSPCCVKLNSGGRGFPFGRRVLGFLNSSKKGWEQASNCRFHKERAYKELQFHNVIDNVSGMKL